MACSRHAASIVTVEVLANDRGDLWRRASKRSSTEVRLWPAAPVRSRAGKPSFAVEPVQGESPTCRREARQAHSAAQIAFGQATGLIEPSEPADTTHAPVRQSRRDAGGVRRAPRSHLGRQSDSPRRRWGYAYPLRVLRVQTGRPDGRVAGCSGARHPANRQHRCRERRRSSAPFATVCRLPLRRRCWPGERAVRQSREYERRLRAGAFA